MTKRVHKPGLGKFNPGPKRPPPFKGTYMTPENLHTIHKVSGPIRAFKFSLADGSSPNYPRMEPVLICKQGAELFVPNADTCWIRECGAGVNVATWEWCISHGGRYNGAGTRAPSLANLYARGRKLWEVEFMAHSVRCIPQATDGKIRLCGCTVIREITRKPYALRKRPAAAKA